LWYTSYLPWLAFISAIGAAISLLIIVSKLNTIYLKERADKEYLSSIDDITFGLGRAASFVFFTYLGLRIVSVTHEGAWGNLNSPFGYWFLLEIALFTIVPIMYYYGTHIKNLLIIRYTAVLAAIAIILNRLNISLITFNWQLPDRELFYWKEIIVLVAIIIIQILVYRWIVNRMPVLRTHPDYVEEGH